VSDYLPEGTLMKYGEARTSRALAKGVTTALIDIESRSSVSEVFTPVAPRDIPDFGLISNYLLYKDPRW
jgi:hypothetical protein